MQGEVEGESGDLRGVERKYLALYPEEDSLLPLFNSILWVLYSLSCLVTL